MPEISIVVPVYKAEDSITRCVNSILKQNFSDFELLLIDDGSPDNSGNMCDTISKTDGRIRVIHQNNQGVSVARNRGIQEACGRYIMFCDSDDYVHPDWCTTLYGAIKERPSSCIVCNVEKVGINVPPPENFI